MSPDAVDVSVIFPVYNEEESVGETLRSCARAAAATPWKWEFIVVDDGSLDATLEVASAIQFENVPVHVIQHATNSGKTAALVTGIRVARGRVIAFMDADLQYDAGDLVRVVELARQGWDGVNGWRAERKDDWGKRYPSRIFNWLIRLAFRVQIRDANSGLKAFRAEAIRSIRLEGDAHRLLIPMISAAGFRVTEIPVRHYPRTRGASKYGVLRLVNGTVSLVGLRMIYALDWNPKGFIPTFWRFVHYQVWPKVRSAPVTGIPIRRRRAKPVKEEA